MGKVIKKVPSSSSSSVSTDVVVCFQTSMGNFKAKLYSDKMPLTVGNIVDLIKNYKFYDGLHIHRVVQDYVIQFGCPNTKDMKEIIPDDSVIKPNQVYGLDDSDDEEEEVDKPGDGSGPPNTTFFGMDAEKKEHTRDEYGNIEDEIYVKGERISNAKKTLSMANSDQPDTGGSQFFINLKDNSHLNWYDPSSESAHIVFGEIIEGYDDVITNIEAVECFPEVPVKPIKIISARIVEDNTMAANNSEGSDSNQASLSNPASTAGVSKQKQHDDDNQNNNKSSGSSSNYYSIEALQDCTIGGLDYANREQYIEPAVFPDLFGVTKDEFAILPKWKKAKLKKKHNLF